MPKVIGLTGGIAMGKSTLAAKMGWLGRANGMGLWLNDADKIVHDLMRVGGKAYAPIIEAFGDVTVAGKGTALDRAKIGKAVFADPSQRKVLEHILHPMVYTETRRFVAKAKRFRVPVVVLDIPLLFETGGEARCDTIISVVVGAARQKRRALARTGMTPEKLAGILRAQVSAQLRQQHSDVIINTGAGKALSHRALVKVLTRTHFTPKRYLAGRRQFGGRGAIWPPMNRRNGFWRRG